jgi:hypothetical protein
MVLINRQPNEEGDRCDSLAYICNIDEHREEGYCVEYCEENPERNPCAREE